MSLGPGSRLGPYEIVSAIGAGGMGEVYKAKDTRLDRTVAIKILPEALTGDTQFRERFDREARAISQFDHPHICTLHDVGEHDGTSFLVMQYLEGETLEARLRKGALPLDQALQLAIQIADALAVAHRAGIVHRDLKPANIMLTKSGAKLLDFGLAKVTDAVVALSGLSLAPTMQSPATMRGTILGTLQYMAPEQIEGREADVRSDIFAFGTVLWEMVTGKKAFEGKSQATLIAAIMSGQPAVPGDLDPLFPPAFNWALARCLSKDPNDRWQTARDLMEELRWVRDAAGSQDVGGKKDARRTAVWAWTVAAIASAIAVGALVTDLRRAPAPAPMMRFTIPISADLRSPVSPDGRQLAYLSKGAVFLRPLNATADRRLDAGIAATDMEWSPDSRSLVVAGDGKLVRINLPEGQAQVLCNLSLASRSAYSFGLTWRRSGSPVRPSRRCQWPRRWDPLQPPAGSSRTLAVGRQRFCDQRIPRKYGQPPIEQHCTAGESASARFLPHPAAATLSRDADGHLWRRCVL